MYNKKEKFIEKSNKKHDTKYDYSKVEYVNSKTKVCIICPEHGEFWQTPAAHVRGDECPKCANKKRGKRTVITESLIEKYQSIHNSKYTYEKTQYIDANTKICVTCPEHGDFYILPFNHLNGQGCPKCKGRNLTQEEIIENFKKIHGDKYDYSKVEYKKSKEKVCITCPIHGDFYQTPQKHLSGQGCPKCSVSEREQNKPMSSSFFIKRSNEQHGNFYTYENISFKNLHEKVEIICPIHGSFKQIAQDHINGHGCPKCSVIKREQNKPMSSSFFIKRSNERHDNFYTYKNISFKNLHEKVEIICPIHGSFKQIAQDHINGHGCPKCNMSRLEEEVSLLLKENNITFEEQKTFDWLKYKSKLRLDFYLPDYDIAIECQGRQHFEAIDIFGGNRFFQVTIERDKKKRELCQKNNIILLYYSNEKIDFPYYVYTDKMELLQEIIKT